MLGLCDHYLHEDMDVDLSTFEYKGCWTCGHFHPHDDFPLLDVNETSDMLNISPSTVIQWIKKGKLSGKLFLRGRHEDTISPPYRKYFVWKDSVEELQKQNDVL